MNAGFPGVSVVTGTLWFSPAPGTPGLDARDARAEIWIDFQPQSTRAPRRSVGRFVFLVPTCARGHSFCLVLTGVR